MKEDSATETKTVSEAEDVAYALLYQMRPMVAKRIQTLIDQIDQYQALARKYKGKYENLVDSLNEQKAER